MDCIKLFLFLIAVVSVSDPVAHAQPTPLPATDGPEVDEERVNNNASHSEPAAQRTISQPESVTSGEGTLPVEGESLPPGVAIPLDGLSLEELLQLAIVSNPALAQAQAQLQALRGRWEQVGLPPNPTIGYAAGEIGDNGTAGQQGGFVGQKFITGGKLRLNQVVLTREIEQAEQRLAATQLRVETDVRKAFYAALIAQRRIELAEELLRLGTEAANASEQLFRGEETSRAGLLQTQIEQQGFAILLQTAKNEQSAAWRKLSAVIGSEIAARPLAGNVLQLPTKFDWDEQLVRVTIGSPEISAAFANVQRAQAALERSYVEPIPDVTTRALVQRDNSTDTTIAGVQVGIPLPIWNRNQGGIRQAQAEVAEARRNADRVELNLKQRLAAAFQQYATAHAQAEIYTTQILPKSQETYELVQRGYREGELGYLDLLAAQRIYSQTNLSYLEALSTLWASWNDIDGMLLADSLSLPPK